MLGLVWILGWGCNEEQPVLTGIPENPLLQEFTPSQMEKVVPKTYVKAADITVDVPNIVGTHLNTVQDRIQAQLGNLLERVSIGTRDGERRIHEKGEFRLVNGEIYMIRFKLPESMRRDIALQNAGFSIPTSRFITTHREYQLHNHEEFRRIRLFRESRETELVTEIEAWKWIPNERIRH